MNEVSASALRKIASLGLSADQMIGMLELLADGLQASEDRRASQRERTRKSRAKRDGNVTVTSQSQDGNVTPPIPDKEIPQTPLENNPYPQTPSTAKAVSAPTAKRSTRLKSDFELTSEWRQVACDLGLPEHLVDLEFQKMRDWSVSSKNGAKLDWLATWRNWCRDAVARLPRNRSGPPVRVNPVIQAGEKLLAEMRAANGTSGTDYPNYQRLAGSVPERR